MSTLPAIYIVCLIKIQPDSRIHLHRLYNKHRNCKRTKHNPHFGQNTKIQKLVATDIIMAIRD